MKRHIEAFNLLPNTQSAYRAHHSTETAVLKVSSDLLWAVDSGNIGVLVLLDLSAAFDTVDHEILLKRLTTSCGISGSALNWFTSYLSNRTQHVIYNEMKSSVIRVGCGVPQGSVLGPMLFTLYTANLTHIMQSNNLTSHLYADDTQIYGWCKPQDFEALQTKMSSCLDEVSRWMRSNRLQLNESITEVMWFGSSRRQHQLPITALRVGQCEVLPVQSVRDLGIYLDSDMSMVSHINTTVSTCFGALRVLRAIRHSVPKEMLLTLVSALVLCRLDYGNATLYGLPANQLMKCQAVLNGAARLIFGLRSRDHVSGLLHQLHWLRIDERISFKIACLTWRCLYGTGPEYLTNDIHRIAGSHLRAGLRSVNSMNLVQPRTRNVSHGDRAWSSASPAVWNRLQPESIKFDDNYLSFRRSLKCYLWSLSYPTS